MLLQEVHYALRTIRAHSGFAAVVVLTLALGLAANAVMFGVVDRLLLSPPAHVHDANRLVRLYAVANRSPTERGASSKLNFPAYTVLRDGVSAFDRVAAYWNTQLPIGVGVDAHQGTVQLATASFFPTLGVQPAYGRFFSSEEDAPHAAARVAVVSDAMWRTSYGGGQRALGRDIMIDGVRYTIIGVAPRGFTGADIAPVDVWVPMSAAAAGAYVENWDTNDRSYWLQIVAHLRPRATRARANEQATAVYRRTDAGQREIKRYAHVGVEAWPLSLVRGPQTAVQRQQPQPELPISLWLSGVALVVLLIACANVSNLFLARALQRRQEIAVRLALGIGRARLATFLITESTLLALCGGAIGLALAYAGGQVIRTTLLPDVAWPGSPVNLRVLVFTGAATLMTGFLTGLAPALLASRVDLARALKAGARQGHSRRGRARRILLVVQTALSVVLLVGAGVFVRSLRNVHGIDLGMRASRLLIVGSSSAHLSGGERDRLLRSARERLEHYPGVEGVSLGTTAPFTRAMSGDLRVPGRDAPSSTVAGKPWKNLVSTDFFQVMGVRVVGGRAFTPADAGQPVLVVNETLAHSYWPGQSPIGECAITSDEVCRRVVGVVEDMRQWRLVDDRPAPQFYTPLPAVSDSTAYPTTLLIIRTSVDPRAIAGSIHKALATMSPELAYFTVQPLDDLIAPQLHPWRLGATMFSVFGALALLIAAIGLYSVLAYGVVQRTHEIGVRMALGARAQSVTKLVVWSTLRTVLAGVAVGLVVALMAGRTMASVLYGVSPHDPPTLVVVSVTFGLVAVLAGALPAWRATRVDPVVALRNGE